MNLNRIALGMMSLLWAGSLESREAYETAARDLAVLEAKGPEALQAKIMELRGNSKETFMGMELPPLYEVVDGVAIFRITGPLITGSAGFMRLFGVNGYDDIRAAAQDILSQKNIKSVLLHVGSPGGSAAGCEDCSAALKALGAVKPIVTFTDTMMASGGYWLGSVGQKILTSRTAILGSVGVIVTHSEDSQRQKTEGINTTVIRAGEFKQLANSNEPLTEEGKAHLKAMAETMYDVFADSISTNLGVTRAKFDAKMGRGREFMGQDAVDAGLAHGIASFDEAFAAAKNVDTSKLNSQNSRHSKGSSMKATLSTGLIAQLVAGAAISSLDFTVAAATAEGVVPDDEAKMLLNAQAITLQESVKSAREKAVSEAVAPLQSELSSAKASLSTANVELGALRTSSGALTEKVQALEVSVEASEKVLRGSIANMCLQLKAPDTSKDVKGTDLVALHTKIEADFTAKFPGARVSAATGANDGEDKNKNSVTATPFWARVSAERSAAQNA